MWSVQIQLGLALVTGSMYTLTVIWIYASLENVKYKHKFNQGMETFIIKEINTVFDN